MAAVIQACQVGHATHEDILVDVILDGPVARIPDVPAVPKNLALSFPMLIWDWSRYENTENYCPGNDQVSMSVGSQGMWEGFETVLTLDVLTGPGLVIDFGAHVGWYTLLATLTGHDVIAIEADVENVRLLNLNLAMNGQTADIRHTWIDELSPELVVDGRVRLVKVDIEGLEDQAIRVCRPLLEARQIDYLLLEISPVFADHYPKTIATVEGYGYRGFVVPARPNDDTPFTVRERFGQDPRRIVQEFPLGDLDFAQRDVLFIREDLCS